MGCARSIPEHEVIRMTASTGGLITKDKDFTFKNPSNEERKSFKSIKTMDPDTPNLS